MEKVIENIKYKRSKDTMEAVKRASKHHAKSVGDGAAEAYSSNMAEEVFEDGVITTFPRPFGIDVHISLYGGEDTHMLSLTGGHRLEAIMVHSAVDSPHEIPFDSSKIDRKTHPTLVRNKLIEVCRNRLPEAIVDILQENGIL